MRDITGQRFGKLTAQWPVGRNVVGRVIWLCSCDCGKLKNIVGHNLLTRNTRACGCIKHRQSDLSRSPEYIAFIAAQGRCHNAKLPYYSRWGGRGIEFRFKDFKQFLAEVGPRPSAKHSLDRINNDGHYEPGNVRWATAKQQMNNRRVNHKVKEY